MKSEMKLREMEQSRIRKRNYYQILQEGYEKRTGNTSTEKKRSRDSCKERLQGIFHKPGMKVKFIAE